MDAPKGNNTSQMSFRERKPYTEQQFHIKLPQNYETLLTIALDLQNREEKNIMLENPLPVQDFG